MKYLLLFLSQGILGYLLQSIGYVLAVFAVCKIRFKAKSFWPIVLIYSVITFAVRQINEISFGYHTVLIMIAFILLAVFMLKAEVYKTVIAVLFTAVFTLLCEIINLGMLNIILGKDTTDMLLKGDGTMIGEVHKALLGVPTNIILIIGMSVFYFLRTRSLTKPKEDSATNGTVSV